MISGLADATAPAVKTEPTPSSSPLPDAVGSDGTTDWSRSYSGLSTQPFAKEIAEVLMAPIDSLDVEIKPGGLFSKENFVLLIMGLRWFTLPS
jgi:Mitochondrial genome maintenance MGM101